MMHASVITYEKLGDRNVVDLDFRIVGQDRTYRAYGGLMTKILARYDPQQDRYKKRDLGAYTTGNGGLII